MKKLVVLTGAGISAESGVKTFRDSGGLWEGHDVMEVASPQGWAKNPELVLDFYNQRRRQLKEVAPNEAHKSIAQLEDRFDVQVITQNVDDLHERGGSSKVLHLHGELLKVRSIDDEHDIYDWTNDLSLSDTCKNGHQLRPHIVWFGEAVPMMSFAIDLVSEADILVVVGTSLQVYPAAGLLHYLPEGKPIYLIDPKPGINPHAFPNLHIIPEKATTGIQKLMDML